MANVGEAEPTKYWLSTLPEIISFRRLVDHVKLRRHIERDYQEFKQEVWLGHYVGRGWCGFHRHAALCIADYGYLISEQKTIPSSLPSATPFSEFAVTTIIDPETPPLRTERYIPNSIAIIRIRYIDVLVRTLPRFHVAEFSQSTDRGKILWRSKTRRSHCSRSGVMTAAVKYDARAAHLGRNSVGRAVRF